MLTLFLILQTILGVFLAWAILIALFGSLRKEPQFPASATPKQHRFAVLVCAHNEAGVIGNLLRSLAAQDYVTSAPAEQQQQRLHVFVLCDHCTDGTADVARKYPHVTVWERHDGARSGKGAVLQWGMTRLTAECLGDFDAVAFFDADNVAAPDFFTRFNDAFNAGHEIVTARRIASNPHDSVVSECYALYWCMINSLCNWPRLRLGTGFAFLLSCLPGGWHTHSMSEDIEFSVQQCLAGHRIDFIGDAHFYDEQPTALPVMYHQLHRWTTGNITIGGLYWRPWLQKFCARPGMMLLDLFLAIGYCVSLGVSAGVYTAFSLYLLVSGNPQALLGAAAFMYVGTMVVGACAAYADGQRVLPLWRGILAYPLFYAFFSMVALWSWFSPNKAWVPIVHTGDNGGTLATK